MEEKKTNRKWVVKAIIGFVVVLALLTFFSNTIMNATIPKVIGAYPSRGNLSYTNNATGVIEAENVSKVKGLDGRKVLSVGLMNYWGVSEGEVVVTLEPITDTTEIDALQTQLTSLLRQREYNQRQPSTPNDYTSLQEGIVQAQQALNEANATLVAAQNKDATIASANSVIQNNQAALISLTAEVEAASATLEDINQQISAIDARIDQIDSQVAIYTALGTPTPTPVDVAAPVPEESTGGEGTLPTGDRTQIDALFEERNDLMSERDLLDSQIVSAQARLSEKSSELSAVNAAIEEAQATLEEAQSLPTVAAAQSAVNLAQSALNQANLAYTNTQIQDGIAADQEQDAAEDLDNQIADLEEQIAKLEATMDINEIKAPADGMIYNLAVAPGDILSADTVIFEVVPEETTYTVTFTFASNVAQTMWEGMDLDVDHWGVDTCRIIRTYPDSENPRENTKVLCSLSGNSLWPGESITATANKGNSTFDHVVPSSAVNEDNSGTFVYVIVQSSSPLGDKCVVKRVDVSIEATDGSMSAISGSGLDDGMVVTRSEEPLQDGDRVRLEDYSNTSR